MSKPSFNEMWNNFPKDLKSTEVFHLVGGKVLELHLEKPSLYSNACAVRMSIACNESGLIIRSGNDDPGQRFRGKILDYETLPGRNYYAYYLSVDGMRKFFIARLGNPTRKLTLFTFPMVTGAKNVLKGKKGIICFRIANSLTATGHLALWNGSEFADGYKDDWFGDSNVTEVMFWELP